MRSIRTVLVAIKDPEARALPALDKAAQLARGWHAKLELFHALTWPLYANGDAQLNEIATLERERVLRRLERLAMRVAGRGRSAVAVSVAATWDHPAYEAVIRRAEAIGADLIVAERHLGRHVAPGLLHFNDWELLRHSPVPVLIVKRARPYQRPVVLAAVDPSHDRGKPTDLESQIMDMGASVTGALKGALHSVHAFQVVYDQLRPEALNQKTVELTNRRLLARARRRYNRLAGHYHVPVARRHLLVLPPADAIEAVATRVDAQIVVIGALSRSGWKRFLIGNTAEAVLDPLRCDLLIVKPRKFVSTVERAARGPRLVSFASLMVA